MRKVCLLLLIMGIIFCGCSGNGKTAKAQDDNDSVLDDTTVVDVVDTTSYVSESDETGGRVVAPSPVVSTDEDDDNEDEVRDVTTTDGDAVYICTGGYSKRYHFDNSVPVYPTAVGR